MDEDARHAPYSRILQPPIVQRGMQSKTTQNTKVNGEALPLWFSKVSHLTVCLIPQSLWAQNWADVVNTCAYTKSQPQENKNHHSLVGKYTGKQGTENVTRGRPRGFLSSGLVAGQKYYLKSYTTGSQKKERTCKHSR